MLDILTSEDERAWLEVLARTGQHDFYHLPQYHRVAEERGEGQASFFVYTDGKYTVGMPLLVRSDLPGGWRDATSVYGYGGPVASHRDLPGDVIRGFQKALEEALEDLDIVSVFSRLHPLIDAQPDILAGVGECAATGTTISIDLTLPDEAQRASYSKNCRYEIRKLEGAGFVGIHDDGMRYLDEFVEVYGETMRRVSADDSYHFDRGYFDLLTRQLGTVSQLFVVLKDDQVAAATICTLRDGFMQDHLGGTRDAYLKWSPDRLVVDTARRWGTSVGARAYHLGGGVGGQEDSLFRYKKGFSKRRHPFYTFRWILLPEAYDELAAGVVGSGTESGFGPAPDGYFPAYRNRNRIRS